MSYTIAIREAITIEDCEFMRRVRNACREFMTNDNSEIHFERQKEWFKSLDRNTLIPFLVETTEKIPAVIGYAIIRFKDDKYWLTGGLLADYRGKGFGEQMFKLLIDQTSLPVWLEVLEDNIPAMKLYQKLGFRSMGVKTNKLAKRVISMVLTPDFIPAD